MALRERFDPRRSPVPLVLALLGGLVLHAVDQATAFRAGPVPILATAPTVAVLAYLRGRPRTGLRRLAALFAWGGVGSGVAVVGVFVVGSTYRLPRPLTDPELVLYDLGLFLWFVLSLTGAYAWAARRTDHVRSVVVAALIGPVLQFGWILLVVGLAEASRFV